MFLSYGRSHVGSLCQFHFSQFLSLGHHVLILDSHNTTTPGSSQGNVLIVLSKEVLGEIFEISEIFLSDISDGNASSGFSVSKLSESCFSFNETEWNIMLSAESWQEYHHLKWVDVMGDNNKFCFIFLNKGGNVIEAELKVDWLWGGMSFGASGSSFSF